MQGTWPEPEVATQNELRSDRCLGTQRINRGVCFARCLKCDAQSAKGWSSMQSASIRNPHFRKWQHHFGRSELELRGTKNARTIGPRGS
eukprot:9926985-Alexandrium_andersonii.AAC.1